MTKVFVYGSLLKGFGNHCLLEDAVFVGEATTKPEFTMVSLGAFPGVFLDGETPLQGEVYEVDTEQEDRLNGLEGVYKADPTQGLYRREFITLEDGTEDILIYIYNGSYRDDAVVESGSWRQHCSERKAQRYG